jgi:hypothetical protein
MSVNWRAKYESCDARRRYAWGKYFGEVNARRDEAEVVVNVIEGGIGRALPRQAEKDIVLPPHITREFYEMGVKLKKDFTCPICMEIPSKEKFEITMCGHSYCKACLETIKSGASPKCAICRKEF